MIRNAATWQNHICPAGWTGTNLFQQALFIYTNGSLNRNLMAKDEFKNLGFAEKPAKKEDEEKGEKGELRW